ncbi:MAG TPA: hypothetical protein PK025_08715 [Spirochaetales bacterium]|nr:hypothetical protein [Spirochaetales bacterium]HPD81117.1 hypothetical protein [Spirochaetales bacterium]HRV28478.1 hypothetical protein [Spirochaetia bacterium]
MQKRIAMEESWLEALYMRNYNEMVESLRQKYPDATQEAIQELTGLLNHYYIFEGNDWIGRGAVQDTAIAATIHALEDFKRELEKQLDQNK